MTKLLVITDFDFSHGGYKNIAEHLMRGMSQKDYDIKVLGLSYRGEEHDYNFSVIPARSLQDISQMAVNLDAYWRPDVLLVMLDIPIQMMLFDSLPAFHNRYIALTPLENGPLTVSWAANLMRMSHVMFISSMGEIEARKAGLTNVSHIQIGIDSEKEWRLPSEDERKQIRKVLGFEDDTFIVLTVADNQERKNLWAGMKAVQKLKEISDRPIRYILVTREESAVGWRLKDLAVSMDLVQEFVIYQRGMPQSNLWGLYAVADAFLLPSKAEGLGLPILEAFATGIPVVGTDTGAITELLEDGRGMLVQPEYEFIDVWGNSKRSMIGIEDAAIALRHIMNTPRETSDRARAYVEQLSWDLSINQLDWIVKKVINEKTQS